MGIYWPADLWGMKHQQSFENDEKTEETEEWTENCIEKSAMDRENTQHHHAMKHAIRQKKNNQTTMVVVGEQQYFVVTSEKNTDERKEPDFMLSYRIIRPAQQQNSGGKNANDTCCNNSSEMKGEIGRNGTAERCFPIVLVHDWALSSQHLTKWKGLAQNRLMLCVDLRGSGESDSIDGPYTIRSMARDIALLVGDVFPGMTCHLVGFGMGGFVAQCLAVEYPELVQSQVLIGSAARYTASKNDAKWMQLLRDVPHMINPFQYHESVMNLIWFLYTDNITCDMIDDLLLQFARSKRTIVGRNAQHDAMLRFDIRKELRTCRKKTLIIHGDNDRAIPVHSAFELAAVMQSSELCIIEHMGHDVSEDFLPCVLEKIATHCSCAENINI